MRYLAFAVLLLTACTTQAPLPVVEKPLCQAGLPVAQPASIDISGLEDRKNEIAPILAHDLAMTGHASGQAPAGYAVSGSVGGSAVDLQVVNVAASCRVIGVQFPILDRSRIRYVAHQIADYLQGRFFGVQGWANSNIAYVEHSQTGYRLIVIDSDGAAPMIVASSREPVMSPAWSPDRTYLAFTGTDRGQSGIYVQKLGTGELRKVVSEKGINGAPAWSLDGRLAFVLSVDGNAEIYIQSLATGERTRLTSDPHIDTEPSWSPDGKQIAFSSDRGGSVQIYLLDLTSNEVKQITASPGQHATPRFSPDGRSLLMVSRSEGNSRITLLDLATGATKDLSEGPRDNSPSFSSNGLAAVYSADDGDGTAHLEIVTLAGVRQALRGADARYPAFSPLIKAR